jgi:hypothetical protein
MQSVLRVQQAITFPRFQNNGESIVLGLLSAVRHDGDY